MCVCVYVCVRLQNMEYKFVELLSLDFTASPEEVVRQQITFRCSGWTD